MRINKWIIIGCIFVSIVGIVAIVIQFNPIVENIGISLLAGAIVSIVTSALYYIYERQSFLAKIKSLLPQFYVNLSVIKAITGDMLSKVTQTAPKSTLRNCA